MKFLRATIEPLPQGWVVKDNTQTMYKIEKVWNQFKKKVRTYLPRTVSQLVMRLFNVFSLCFVLFWCLFWFFCLPSLRVCVNDTKYCKQGIYKWLFCVNETLQLIIFQLEGFHEVRICLLQVVSGCFLLVSGHFRSFPV